ncbi:hypothetical protein KC328_g37 [Hortaea werneckii]|nr:hypothetical protein KC328_g37 [Hortaea werneckii]
MIRRSPILPMIRLVKKEMGDCLPRGALTAKTLLLKGINAASSWIRRQTHSMLNSSFRNAGLLLQPRWRCVKTSAIDWMSRLRRSMSATAASHRKKPSCSVLAGYRGSPKWIVRPPRSTKLSCFSAMSCHEVKIGLPTMGCYAVIQYQHDDLMCVKCLRIATSSLESYLIAQQVEESTSITPAVRRAILDLVVLVPIYLRIFSSRQLLLISPFGPTIPSPQFYPQPHCHLQHWRTGRLHYPAQVNASFSTAVKGSRCSGMQASNPRLCTGHAWATSHLLLRPRQARIRNVARSSCFHTAMMLSLNTSYFLLFALRIPSSIISFDRGCHGQLRPVCSRWD